MPLKKDQPEGMIKRVLAVGALFSRRDKLKYMILLALMSGGALLDVVGIGAVPAFVAALAVPDKVRAFPAAGSVLDYLDIQTPQQMVIWGALALIVIFVIKNLYLLGVYYLQVRTTEYHRVRMADRMFRAYMYAPWEYHLMHNSSELLRNVTTETTQLIAGVINPLLSFAMTFMMTLLTVILLLVTTPGVAVVGLGLVGGASWGFLKVVRKRLDQYGQEAKRDRRGMIQSVSQGLAGLMEVRVLGREEFFLGVLYKSLANFARVSRLNQVIKKVAPGLLELVAVSGLLGIVLTLVLIGREAASLVPMLALYGAAIVRLRASVAGMVGAIGDIQFSSASIPTLVGDIAKLEPLAIAGRKERVARKGREASFEEKLDLSDVTYSYPNTDRPALENISLAIHPGESVGFVGATGSGKSTLVNVILGLLEPQRGSVCVDGGSIFDDRRSWLDNVGYIPQAIVLLDDTIARNVAFGRSDKAIDESRLWSVLEAAQLADYVRTLPESLDTVVGERGMRLSGGQRQRIGLARALYHNPAVLIMDEATAALDNQTENLVMQALESQRSHRTLIMIAHRLSTVRNCDRLYYLREGELVASGSYEALIHEVPEFREMAEMV